MVAEGNSGHLDSWKAIAAFLNRDIRTVQRWERTRGLPVHRLPGEGRGSVYAIASEIKQWQQRSVSTSLPLRSWWKYLLGWRGGLAAALAGLALTILWGYPRRGSSTTAVRIIPLTTLPGDERWPVFSPDGKRVAYVSCREGTSNCELHVMEIASAATLRIAEQVGSAPAWSHDGQYLAYKRSTRDATGPPIMVVPARGGYERQVGRVARNLAGRIAPELAWTRDDQAIIAADRESAAGPYCLVRISVQTGGKKILTRPSSGQRGDQAPSLSPDGRTLGFVRAASVTSRDLWLLPLIEGDGEPKLRQATFEGCCVSNPMWNPAGTEILYLSQRADGLVLLRLPAGTGRAGKPAVISALPACSFFSVSPTDGRIAFSTFRYDEDIWQADLRSRAPPHRLIRSTRNEEMPDLSTDGTAIAFSSDRSGMYEIWTSRADGSYPRCLTKSAKGSTLTPRWSPDGRWIAFECALDICVVPAHGGETIRVTSQGAGDVLPSWSRDGKWLYFGSGRSGEHQIWKVLMTQGGPGATAVPVTRYGGYGGIESPDGRTFYYGKWEQSGEIWSVPVAGGAETPLPVALTYYQRPENFAASRSGLYSLAYTSSTDVFDLLYWRFDTTTVERIATLPGTLGTGLWVAPNDSFVLYSAVSTQPGDLMLLEQVR